MKKIVSIFKNGRVMVLIAIMIVLTITCPGMFLTGSNFSSILLSVSLYGIMTAGAIYCCLTSGPDLSVGGMAALSSVISVRIILQITIRCRVLSWDSWLRSRYRR